MPQVGPGFLELCFAHGPCWYGMSGGGCTLSRIDLWHLPWPLHWPGRDLPVRFSHLMRWRTQVEWQAQYGWRRGCQCVKGCWLCGGGFVGWLVGCVGGVVECHCVPFGVVQAVLYYSGIVCGLPVVGQNFLENGVPWGTGQCCCECVLAPPFLRSIEYITSVSSSSTHLVSFAP